MARVRYINNDGAGFSDAVQIPDGMTVEQFLQKQGVTNPSAYHIRVNGQECVIPEDTLKDGDRVSVVARPGTTSPDQQLAEGDRVSVTPKRVAGAFKALEQAIFKDC
jgi:sulfur carrier protein ThiS